MNCSCSTLHPAPLSIVLMNRGRKLWKFDRKHHMWFYLLHALPHITRQILQDPTKSVKLYLNRNALKSLPLHFSITFIHDISKLAERIVF